MKASLVKTVVGVFCWLLVSPSHAAGTTTLQEALSMTYKGECLDHESLASAVAQWLGGADVDAELAVQVEGADKPAPHARFELRRAGEAIAIRRFDSLQSCEDLQKALPFAIALAIDARVVQARSATLPAPRARPDPHQAPAEPPMNPAPEAQPNPAEPVAAVNEEALHAQLATAHASPSQRAPRAFHVLLQTHWLRAVAPQALWAAQLALGWRLRNWLEVAIGGLASLPDSSRLDVGRANYMLAGAVAQVCARWNWAVAVRGCLGGAGGILRAEGVGYSENLQASQSWSSGVAGLDVAWPPRARLAVRMTAQLLPALRRPALTVKDNDDSEIVRLRAPPLGASVGLGLSLSL